MSKAKNVLMSKAKNVLMNEANNSIYMAKIKIKLTVVEWDIGGKEDRSRYEANCETPSFIVCINKE